MILHRRIGLVMSFVNHWDFHNSCHITLRDKDFFLAKHLGKFRLEFMTGRILEELYK